MLEGVVDDVFPDAVVAAAVDELLHHEHAGGRDHLDRVHCVAAAAALLGNLEHDQPQRKNPG